MILYYIHSIPLLLIANPLNLESCTVANPQQQAILGEQALSLTVRCLNFDFIGTNPDESTEDVGTIQAPTSWRPVLQDPATTELLFDFYAKTEPPRSSKAMEAVILLSSIRRSLFPTDKDRAAFLGRLVDGIRELLKNQTGLQHQDNYHQFCRLLGRLKANYQLSELVKTEGYLEWLELAANFTVQSIRNWQYSTNSIHYLLALWGRLVAAVPYVRPETGARGHVQLLEKQVLLVAETYIESMLASVETVLRSEGALDDPLDDDGSLKEQLDRLPVICRFQYGPVANLILQKFDPLLNQYRELLALMGTNSTDSAPQDVQQRMAIIEGQLTWLSYIVGTIVGGHSWSSAHMGEGEETIDASLSRRALQLAQVVDYRLTSSNGVGRADPKLELALLYYFQNFRRVYMFMWDQVSGTNPGSATGVSVSVVAMNVAKLDSAPSTKQKVYQRMFDHLQMGDHTAVANLIVTKMGNDLKFWPEENEIVGKTLELLHDMAGGYSSSKLLLTLETVRYLARHHTEDQFPFLTVPSNTRHRTTFHSTLTRLLLSPNGEEKLGLTFEQFMEPLINTLGQLGALSPTDLRSENCRRPLIGVFRDLRGVTASLHNRRSYGLLFDLLHPNHLLLLSNVADVWHDQPDVIISVLRFLHEFCHNKANRVNFDQSSPNGILLFRATSDVVCAFGRRLLAAPRPDTQDIYKKRYKGMGLALNVLNSALGGNYVCFGVFGLYNDPALDNSLDVALQMALSVSLEDVVAYPKLSKAYFGFIEILFRNHKKTVFALETNIFMQLMTAVHEGLQSSDATLSSLCANTIDHLATFYFTMNGKDKIEMHNLNNVSPCPQNVSIPDSTFANPCPFSASCRTTQLVFEPHSHTLQSLAVWSSTESLGCNSTNVESHVGQRVQLLSLQGPSHQLAECRKSGQASGCAEQVVGGCQS
jgi:exportin-7